MLNDSMNRGFYAWAAWLAFTAWMLIIALLALNLIGKNSIFWQTQFNLGSSLHPAELLVLLFLTGFYFINSGNLFAFGTLIYLGFRVTQYASSPIDPAVILLVAAHGVLVVLADRLPWHRPDTAPLSSKLVRNSVFFVAGLGTVLSLAYALATPASFYGWLVKTIGLQISLDTLLLGLITSLGIWLATIVGFFRRYWLLVAVIPSVFSVEYAVTWPSLYSAILLTILICFSISGADKTVRVK